MLSILTSGLPPDWEACVPLCVCVLGGCNFYMCVCVCWGASTLTLTVTSSPALVLALPLKCLCYGQRDWHWSVLPLVPCPALHWQRWRRCGCTREITDNLLNMAQQPAGETAGGGERKLQVKLLLQRIRWWGQKAKVHTEQGSAGRQAVQSSGST